MSRPHGFRQARLAWRAETGMAAGCCPGKRNLTCICRTVASGERETSQRQFLPACTTDNPARMLAVLHNLRISGQ